MPSLIQKVIHLSFVITDRFAPGFAGELAFRLFCTTPGRKPRSENAQKVLVAAAPVMAQTTRSVLTISKGAVSAWYFKSPKGRDAPLALVTHGWGSRSEHMLSIIQGLQNSGHAVVALDLPGHGHSTGRKLDMALAVQAVDAVWRQFGPVSTMVGHSFGGAVVVNAAYGSVCGIPARRPKRLVLISAPSALPAVFVQFADWLGLGDNGRKALFDRVGQVTGRPLREFIGARQVAELALPTLVVHAREDREVSADHARDYASSGCHVDVLWADGYGHRRILRAPCVVSSIVDFVDQQPAAQAA